MSIWLRSSAYWIMVLTLCLIPWLLGGNRPPFLVGAATLLAFAAVIAVGSYWRFGVPQFRITSPWLWLFLVACWLSPPASAIKRPFIELAGLNVGHDVHLENLLFYQSISCAFLALLIPLVFNNLRRTRLAILLLSGNAVLQVLYAGYVLALGDRFLYWPEGDLRLAGESGVAEGNFPNRNHFAGHLEMALFLTLGLLVGYYLKAHQKMRDSSVVSKIVDFFLGPEGRLRAVIIILTIGLVLTQSRSGNIAYLVTLAFAALMLYVYLPEARRTITILFLSIVVVDIAIISSLVGLEKVVERVASTQMEEEARVDFNLLSLRIIADYWLTGIGGGNYLSFVRGYQELADQQFFLYAHNDFLQMMAELGVPVFCVLVVYVLMSVGAGIHAFIYRQHPFYRGIGLGAACATISLCIHSFSDFNHQIPANSFLFVTCTSLCWLCKSQSDQRQTSKGSN